MKILALDASTEALSVALLDTAPTERALEHFEMAPQAHARRLLPAAETLLAEAGWPLTAIDGLAFGRGPGAFTGLRIAAGLVQGLAAGLDRPVSPVSTLAALAARCFVRRRASMARVVQDARLGEIYTADYCRHDDQPELVGSERVIEPAELGLPMPADMILAGNGWPLLAAAHALDKDTFEVAETHPHALDIARLAWPVLERGEGVPASLALPVYVRDDVARKSASRT